MFVLQDEFTQPIYQNISTDSLLWTRRGSEKYRCLPHLSSSQFAESPLSICESISIKHRVPIVWNGNYSVEAKINIKFNKKLQFTDIVWG